MKTQDDENHPHIDLDTAVHMTLAWQELVKDMKGYGDLGILRAFNIPRYDLEGLLKEGGVENPSQTFRAYLAYDEFIADLHPRFKLVIVGVDKDDKDRYEEPFKIYDFTNPCPNSCDKESPLATGMAKLHPPKKQAE